MGTTRKQRPWLWVEAVCKQCACSAPGRHVRANHIGTRAATQAAENDALEAGWTTDRIGDWTCPTCAKADTATRALTTPETER